MVYVTFCAVDWKRHRLVVQIMQTGMDPCIFYCDFPYLGVEKEIENWTNLVEEVKYFHVL